MPRIMCTCICYVCTGTGQQTVQPLTTCLLPVKSDERIEATETSLIVVVEQRLNIRDARNVTRAKERNGIRRRQACHVNGSWRGTGAGTRRLQQRSRIAGCAWQIRDTSACNSKGASTYANRHRSNAASCSSRVSIQHKGYKTRFCACIYNTIGTWRSCPTLTNRN